MEKIRIGIVGLGMAWEKLHSPAYQRLGDRYEIVAVCDIDKEKALDVSKTLGIPESNVFTSYKRMIDCIELDAVDTMVPIRENYEVAKYVLENGLHLIAEKPFASTPEAAKELVKIAQRSDARVIVAENYRYEEENRIIKGLLEQNAIGKVAYFIDNKVKDFHEEMKKDTFSAKEWRQHPDFDGGIFLDSAVHHIAMLRFLFGEVESVYATGQENDDDYCPYACVNALLKFKSKVSGYYTYFTKGKESQAPLVGFRIFGESGEIYLEERECGCINLTFKNGGAKQIYYKPCEGYYNELLNFYNSIVSGEEIVSTPEKELGDIEVVRDIIRAIETNKVQHAPSGFFMFSS